MNKSYRMLWLYVPILNALQQIFLKQSASTFVDDFGMNWLTALLSSPWFLLAIAAEIACFVLWIRILAEVDLTKAFPISAISYVFVLASAWFLYDEPASLLQLVGSALIMTGVWWISTASTSTSRSASP
ncbi:EamA family transporter [Rhizobium helianthi]|uniref:EamA family transporter n=1 Tax=Rhizobium helianthi TaxID=1132695 RepID=A0ABW4M7F6_9HYPH